MSSGVVLWSIAYSCAAIIIVSGNSLAIAAFFTSKKLMRMRASYFLVSLAVADMLIGIITIPMYIALLHYHVVSKEYQSVFTAVDIASGSASVFTLTTISIERLYSFWFPLHYRANNAPRTYLGVVAGVWCLSGIITTLHILYRYHIISYTHFFYVMMSALSFCLLAMCMAYVGIFLRVRKHYRQNQCAQRNERRFVYMLFTITALFVVTWLPFHLLNIVNFFCDFCLIKSLPHQLLFACKFLHYTNSLVNPIIYSFQMPEFKKTVKSLVGCAARGDESRRVEEIPLARMRKRDDADTTQVPM
ncbi:5-hydroxytryptamine receptor 6 [Nematostella vectensis]|uniref:5-hydroxytryptamine receptor 6 n=1 Tax=Nematostella vectensis TaxID=45351 RepID=UPI00138FE7B5|nr:5-hydroxytryptamine receptor 6 [Nematostella vectensis]